MSEQLSEFHPRERTEGDSYKPSEHIGALLIVKVNDHKHIATTIHKPEGGPAIVVDVCDLSAGGVFRDVLWMNGAIVDELRAWIGKRVVIKFIYTKSTKGMDYITVVPATPEELAHAQAIVAQRGDPFAAPMSTTAPPPPLPPAEIRDPWSPSPAGATSVVSTTSWNPPGAPTGINTGGAQAPFATEDQPPF